MKTPSSVLSKKQRHDPLHVQMSSDAMPDLSAKKKRNKYSVREDRREKKEVDPKSEEKMTKKILEQARLQIEEEEGDGDEYFGNDDNVGQIVDESDEDFDGEFDDDQNEYEELDHDLNDQLNTLTREEEDIIAQFMPSSAPARRNLADLIMSKLNQQESDEKPKSQINEKVAEVYAKVGVLLSRYRSGKLPKAFKILPTLRNWEEILYLTNPESWTPHAMYQATRIFSSNLKPKMAQRFFKLILLNAVRDDLATNKKVNYHLYAALKKATYKPSAWFKGILLPMCESGCTLREALIMGSVLSKVSVPVLHSAAALMKLAEMEYTGANSIFIRILLDKKYALPYRVIDSLVFHFLGFRHDERKLPVLWHQSLLVFCQRYKEDMSVEQKEAILELLKHQWHHQISPEVRRELVNSKSREGMEVTMPVSSEQAIQNAVQMHLDR